MPPDIIMVIASWREMSSVVMLSSGKIIKKPEVGLGVVGIKILKYFLDGSGDSDESKVFARKPMLNMPVRGNSTITTLVKDTLSCKLNASTNFLIPEYTCLTRGSLKMTFSIVCTIGRNINML